MKKIKLSVVLATFNEEKNITACLDSIREIADELVIVDGSSSDRTVEIAKKFQATVVVTNNPPNFHINKQKALEMAKGEWILQLDADEQLTKELSFEIVKVISMTNDEIEEYQKHLSKKSLFLRHQHLIEERDGKIGEDTGNYTAFFIPRLNFFLGKFLHHGGVYPDGVIRLVKNGKARFPAKDVHEQIAIEGRVGWLENDLVHMADPTFQRYLLRNSRYIDLITEDMKRKNEQKNIKNFFNYVIIKPLSWFFMTQIRHKGLLDGFPGIIFSFFSALRFPRAYWRYLKND